MGDNDQNNTGGGKSEGGDGQIPQWMASLPDAHKNNEAFKQFKEPAQVWDKLDTLLKAEGKMVQIPGDGAKPEEIKAFHSKLGVPEKADDYEIKKPDGLPADFQYEPMFEKVFREKAHALNIPKGSAEALWNWYFDLGKQGHEQLAKQSAEEAKAVEKAQIEAHDALKRDWADKFDHNKNVAVLTFKKFGGEGMAELLETVSIGKVKLGDHPALLKQFYEIGLKTLDDTELHGGGGAGGDKGGDPTDAQAEILFGGSMGKNKK